MRGRNPIEVLTGILVLIVAAALLLKWFLTWAVFTATFTAWA